MRAWLFLLSQVSPAHHELRLDDGQDLRDEGEELGQPGLVNSGALSLVQIRPDTGL